jgi:large subunit ribosomal protein L10
MLFTGGDPIRPCKVLKEFMKDHEQITIKGGVLDGKMLSEEKVNELAELPGREVLLAKLLFLMRASTQGLVNVLNGVPQALVHALEAIRQKKEE